MPTGNCQPDDAGIFVVWAGSVHLRTGNPGFQFHKLEVPSAQLRRSVVGYGLHRPCAQVSWAETRKSTRFATEVLVARSFLKQINVGALEHLERRRNVEHGQRVRALGMISGQPTRDSGTAVVAYQVEPIEAKRSH